MGRIFIHFENTNLDEGNVLTSDLESFLAQNYNVANTEMERIKADKNTMDGGAILAIILGASSVVEIAKGISAYLQKLHGKSIRITDEKGEIVGEGLSHRDIETILSKRRT
jgi:hypothetical protein